MDEKDTPATFRMKLLLAAGLLLVVLGIFLLVAFSSRAERVFAFRPAVLLCAGVLLLYVALAFTRSGTLMFAGLLCLLQGVIFLLADTGIIHCSLRELWPTLMMSMGIALVPAGLYAARRVRTVYLFPAIMMVVLGAFFLLFSLHVVRMPLSAFMLTWWPLIILGGGIALVVLFLVQQRHAKDFPFMEDDSLVEGEVNEG